MTLRAGSLATTNHLADQAAGDVVRLAVSDVAGLTC